MDAWGNDLADDRLDVARRHAFEMHLALLEPRHRDETVIMAADYGHQTLLAPEAHGFADSPLPAILLLHCLLALLNAG